MPEFYTRIKTKVCFWEYADVRITKSRLIILIHNVTGCRLQCVASALSLQFNVFLQILSIVRAHIIDNQKMQSSKENLLQFNAHKIASHSRM